MSRMPPRLPELIRLVSSDCGGYAVIDAAESPPRDKAQQTKPLQAGLYVLFHTLLPSIWFERVDSPALAKRPILSAGRP